MSNSDFKPRDKSAFGKSKSVSEDRGVSQGEKIKKSNPESTHPKAGANKSQSPNNK